MADRRCPSCGGKLDAVHTDPAAGYKCPHCQAETEAGREALRTIDASVTIATPDGTKVKLPGRIAPVGRKLRLELDQEEHP